MYSHIFFSVFFIIALCMALYYIATRKGESKTEFLIITLFSAIVMVSTFLFEVTATDISQAKQALYAQFIGYTPFNVFFLLESFRVCGYEIKRKYVFSGVMYTFSVIVIAVTNNFHELYYNVFHFGLSENGNYVLSYSYGPIGMVNFYVIYIFIFIAVVNIFIHYSRWNMTLKKQLNYMVAGILVSSLIHTLTLTDVIKSDYDTLSYTFSLAVLIYTYGIYVKGTFDIEALAVKMSMKNMKNGMLVLDKEWNFVFANDTIKEKEPALNNLLQGDTIENIDRLPDNIRKFNKEGMHEIKYLNNEKLIYIQTHVDKIVEKNKLMGYVLTFTDITDIKNSLIEAETVAYTDTLTKVLNRRGLFKQLDNLNEKEIQTTSMLLMDIDHFKMVNDTYGHDIGDIVLVSLSDILRKCVNDIGVVSRYGGEEFIICIPNVDLERSLVEAEKIRQAVEMCSFQEVGKITISIGVCMYDKNMTRDEWIKKSDEALYAAKKAGRNAVFYYDGYEIKPYTNIANRVAGKDTYINLHNFFASIPLKVSAWTINKEFIYASQDFIELLQTDIETYSKKPHLFNSKYQKNNELSENLMLKYFDIAQGEIIENEWNFITSMGELIYTKISVRNLIYANQNIIVIYIEDL